MVEFIKNWATALPEKKRWFDVLAAMLTVPVMVTVLILNINNLNNKKTAAAPAEKEANPTQVIRIVQSDTNSDSEEAPTPIPTLTLTPTPLNSASDRPSCKSELPAYTVISPLENESVNVNPVCINLAAQGDGFCPVEWSYRVNNSAWSGYTNDQICLYNMVSGPVKLEVRTRSTETNQEQTYSRNFTYLNPDITGSPTVTVTPTVTP